MSKHELLNNITHKNIKVIMKRSAEYGDDIWFTPTFWREFRSVQSCYPILFKKENDSFIPVAFFGFEKAENLFLSEQGWDAAYIPLSVQRLPFYIGVQQRTEGSEHRVVTIDMDSPRISRVEGVELFMEYGGNSEFLDNMANMLETLHEGVAENGAFIQALLENELLESVTLDITLNDQSTHQLIGFHTINESKLKELNTDVLSSFHASGYLQAIYAAAFSQVKFGELIRRKNKRMFG